MFCLGVESGAFKHTEELQVSTISDILTPSHEAHFRAEIWWTLPHAFWRHGIGIKHAARRIHKLREFLPLVKEDRRKNEEAAMANRKQAYLENVNCEENDPETTQGLDVVDSMYWE